MFRLSICIVLILYALHSIADHGNSFAGPYELHINQIAQCENKGLDITRFDKTRITKYNRTTYVYSSNFSLPYGFTDNVMILMSAFVNGNGGWKVLQKNQLIGPACSSAKRLSPQLVEAVAKSIGTWPTLCPNPPGNYTIKDLPLNFELEIPILPYNNYMFEFWMTHKGKRLGCGKMFVDVVPKKKKRRH